MSRRSIAVIAATALALATIPAVLPVLSEHALSRATSLDDQGRADEARVEADLAAALDPTSVDVQLERASLLQSLRRPGRRPPRRAAGDLAGARRLRGLAAARRLRALVLERQGLEGEPRRTRAPSRATTRSSTAATPT